MVVVDYYCVLEIEEPQDVSNITQAQIKKAYRSLALVYHPDKSDVKDSVIFRQIQESYEVLTDAARKREYDQQYASRFRRRYVGVEEVDFERSRKIKVMNLLKSGARLSDEEAWCAPRAGASNRASGGKPGGKPGRASGRASSRASGGTPGGASGRASGGKPGGTPGGTQGSSKNRTKGHSSRGSARSAYEETQRGYHNREQRYTNDYTNFSGFYNHRQSERDWYERGFNEFRYDPEAERRSSEEKKKKQQQEKERKERERRRQKEEAKQKREEVIFEKRRKELEEQARKRHEELCQQEFENLLESFTEERAVRLQQLKKQFIEIVNFEQEVLLLNNEIKRLDESIGVTQLLQAKNELKLQRKADECNKKLAILKEKSAELNRLLAEEQDELAEKLGSLDLNKHLLAEKMNGFSKKADQFEVLAQETIAQSELKQKESKSKLSALNQRKLLLSEQVERNLSKLSQMRDSFKSCFEEFTPTGYEIAGDGGAQKLADYLSHNHITISSKINAFLQLCVSSSTLHPDLRSEQQFKIYLKKMYQLKDFRQFPIEFLPFFDAKLTKSPRIWEFCLNQLIMNRLGVKIDKTG